MFVAPGVIDENVLANISFIFSIFILISVGCTYLIKTTKFRDILSL